MIGQKIDIVKLIALDANSMAKMIASDAVLELIPNKKSETAYDYATKLRVDEALAILTPIHQAGAFSFVFVSHHLANDPKRKKKEKEDKKQKEKETKEKEKEDKKQEKEKLEKEKLDKVNKNDTKIR